jgi:hypothetical protein
MNGFIGILAHFHIYTARGMGIKIQRFNHSKIQRFKDSRASGGDNCRGYAQNHTARSIIRVFLFSATRLFAVLQ